MGFNYPIMIIIVKSTLVKRFLITIEVIIVLHGQNSGFLLIKLLRRNFGWRNMVKRTVEWRNMVRRTFGKRDLVWRNDFMENLNIFYNCMLKTYLMNSPTFVLTLSNALYSQVFKVTGYWSSWAGFWRYLVNLYVFDKM